MKKILALILSSFFILSGCFSNSCASFDAFTNSLFCEELSSNTLNLHYTLVDASAYGISDYRVTLGDFSKKARDSSESQLSETYNKLMKINRDSLSDKQKLDYDVLKDYLVNQIALSKYSLYDEILSPSNGIHAQLPILLSEYKFRSFSDIEEYFLLLSDIDSYYNQVLEFEKEKSEKGLFMCDKFCLEVINECKAFISKTDNNILISSFARRLDKLPSLTSSEKKQYSSTNLKLFTNHVIPAYNKLIQGLTSLLGTGHNIGGICKLPDGKNYFSLLAQSSIGSNKSVNEIYKQIEKQRQEDLAVLNRLSSESLTYTDLSSVKLPFKTQKQMLSALQEAITDLFPKACQTNCSLCPVDSSLSDSLAPAFYITAPYDSYKDNSIYVNSASDYDDLSLFTTLAHEGYPGHLYQTVMSYNYGLSPIRSILNYEGYTEGWATYVEMQAYHYAGLEEDTAAFFQKNQAITLSLYASSDIGIHYYGWDFNKLLDFWSQYGISDPETIEQIQDYITSSPANYLKYYVGYLEFLNIKKIAQKKYGDSFNAIKFHKALLQIGPAPFDIINKYLDEYYNNA